MLKPSSLFLLITALVVTACNSADQTRQATDLPLEPAQTESEKPSENKQGANSASEAASSKVATSKDAVSEEPTVGRATDTARVPSEGCLMPLSSPQPCLIGSFRLTPKTEAISDMIRLQSLEIEGVGPATISLEAAADSEGFEDSKVVIEAPDLNFDGHADIAFGVTSGAVNLYLDYWLWHPEQNRFVALGHFPELRPSKTRLGDWESFVRINAANYEQSHYRVVDGKLVVTDVEKISGTAAADR